MNIKNMEKAAAIKTNLCLGAKVFYAPYGCLMDDGEVTPAGWYIQLDDDDNRSDGIGPYNTVEEALMGMSSEFGFMMPFSGTKAARDFEEYQKLIPEDGEPLATP